ncbi:hypothetical protein C8034_v000422 [Colletotrichum sidae]|uniref:Uncharacterized protein n=1 Tax=Colletotrichum sidae TaxID=1347389 RepID=A0A4R8T0D1_9PEZI|nr:hypothetical protein C8034_v000422 [Colletotrichum sidae]
MCIRHVQTFECPSREGPPKRHRLKSNILCAHTSPCPDAQWERRTSHYSFMCPTCSGEPPEVPREKPKRDIWEREASEDEAWVNAYVASFAEVMLLWVWGFHDTNNLVRELTQLYPALYYERRCKEHGHRPSHCKCEANGTLSFLYNPATSVRRSYTNRVASHFWSTAVVHSEHARQVFAGIHRDLATACRTGNRYFRGGIARQPFFSKHSIDKRRNEMSRIVKGAWLTAQDMLRRASAQYIHCKEPCVLMEEEALNRKCAVELMGEIMMYDTGISNFRFCRVVEVLASMIQEPSWRPTSKIVQLDQLGQAVSRFPAEQSPKEALHRATVDTRNYFDGKRKTWAEEMRSYRAKRLLFDCATTLVDAAKLPSSTGGGGGGGGGGSGGGGDDESRCMICLVDFWESPSMASAPVTPRLGERATGPGQGGGHGQQAEPPWLRAAAASELSSTQSDVSNQLRDIKWDWQVVAEWRGFRGGGPAGVDVADHGEPAVRIDVCKHVVGRSCLFRGWVTESNMAEQRPRCPKCRAEPSALTYRMVEAAVGFSINPDGRSGWHLRTGLLSLLNRYT